MVESRDFSLLCLSLLRDTICRKFPLYKPVDSDYHYDTRASDKRLVNHMENWNLVGMKVYPLSSIWPYSYIHHCADDMGLPFFLLRTLWRRCVQPNKTMAATKNRHLRNQDSQVIRTSCCHDCHTRSTCRYETTNNTLLRTATDLVSLVVVVPVILAVRRKRILADSSWERTVVSETL